MSVDSGTTVAKRPVAGEPRPYTFPAFTRTHLDNGLAVIAVDLPGRSLLSGVLVMLGGAADDPDDEAGATVLMGRALSEGTELHDAVAFVEATERLGASIHAEVGWDSVSISVEVPAARFPAALGLAAEMAELPTFPAGDVERLRDERLNDLLQARADPRRRAEDAFIETIYAPSSPYRHSAAGTRETVERLGPAEVRAARSRGFDPGSMTLLVGGDLTGVDVHELAAARFGDWRPDPAAAGSGLVDAAAASRERRIRVVHRPGAVQTEIRIGHPGLARRIPDFHAVAVMSTLLGGLFNSRLNRRLREEKGYTYGASAGFDLRRSAGPFSARAAVNTDVTVPAVVDMMAELERIRTSPPSEAEVRAARDFLIGVFPLRFETPDAVIGSLSSLVVQGLPDDELARYRPAVEGVDVDAAFEAARAHVRPQEAAIVLVGDADAFLPALEAADLGPITVDREGPTSSEASDVDAA
ncbi:MAG: insulinase family protein [Chloroflexi bacterium]|nr:insulinase family protein [Chloroflexota bacterium]